MLQYIISLNIIILSILFSQMSHPLTMGLMLIIQTFLITLITGLIHKSFWFSYILFLIFLGGMLIMFIYVTTLSSNEMFTISPKLMILMMIMLFSLTSILLIIDHSLINKILNYETFQMFNFNMFLNENLVNLNKMYTYPTNLITLFLIIYLFLTLIMSVKITNFFYGPLRPSF